jgi:hypothetical protein
MLVVEFVLIIRNFVEHVGDYFPYSKLVKNFYLSNFLMHEYVCLQSMRYLNDESFQLVLSSHLAIVV